MNEKMLKEYARLIVEVGINVQKGQRLVVNCPVDCAEFGRMLTTAAYDAGARDVIVNWRDDYVNREHWLKADDDVFDTVNPWDVQKSLALAKEGAGHISIAASNPENLRGVDPDRLRRFDVAVGRDMKESSRLMMANYCPWCVVSIPILSWAKKVFPDLSDEAAMDRLWQEIFSAVRITEDGDAVEAWREHCNNLETRSAKLNEYRFKTLRYTNSLGTDLTVGMPEEHVWMAGGDTSRAGIKFVANMPTEEIFSAPKKDEVNGVLYASKPLNLRGNIVDGIRLTFEKGRIVDIHADQGEDILRAAIETDEGSHYLGEIALVPYDSPISNSGVLFFNTLFDENASCHFAFGEAYPSCVKGGDDLPMEELLKRGINADSSQHVDFMVGTADLSIIGTTEDGREIPVFVDGNFVI
ncbi:MAG: aminopeptidase [Ruminococcaceae bacterium]|nr:aminopeptidase [Oscillospiraceae bacterium]